MTLFMMIATGALVLAGAAYFFWVRKVEGEVQEGAADAWERLRQSEPEIIDGYNEERFRRVYRRVHVPRFPGYALGAVAVYFVSLPLTLALMGAGLWAGRALGFLPQPAEIARYIPLGETTEAASGMCSAECKLYVAEAFSGFYFFFAVIFVWIAVFAFFMRRYHARRPGYLRDELIRNRP